MSRVRRNTQKIFRVSFSAILAAVLSGCGKFDLNPEIGAELSFFKESLSNRFIPEDDQVREDCRQTAEVCVYLKNPTFQEQEVIKPSESQKLLQAQKFSVRLTGMDRSGFVKNENIDVLTVKNQRLSIQEALNSKGVKEDFSHATLLNSYYWLNRAKEYLKNRWGDFPSSKHSVKVYVDDSYDGWVWSTRSIHLDQKKFTALSGEVLLLLFAEAQIGFATQGQIYNHPSTAHQQCLKDVVGCCRSSLGCSKALLRGAASAFVAFLFEDSPAIGEFHLQNRGGQDICGKPRSPEAFREMTFQQAFDLCPERQGSSLALGMVYSSIWFEVRKNHSDPVQVEKVFLKHLYKLTGEDDFQTARQKIIESCHELGTLDLIPLFQSEFSKR